jgi:hypothetical protein
MNKGAVFLVAVSLGLSSLLLLETRRQRLEMERLRENISRLEGHMPAEQGPVSRAGGPQEFSAHVESAFLREAEDPHWTREVRRSLEEQLAARPEGGAALHSLECHVSLCRLELLHPGEEQYQRFMLQALHGQSFWKGATLTTRKENVASGGIMTVSYLMREGEPLPAPTHVPNRP